MPISRIFAIVSLLPTLLIAVIILVGVARHLAAPLVAALAPWLAAAGRVIVRAGRLSPNIVRVRLEAGPRAQVARARVTRT